MFLFRKKILTISLAVMSVLCVACNNTTSTPDTNTDINSNSNDVVVNNAQIQDVDEDMAPSDEEKVNINIGLIKNSAAALGATPLFSNSEDNSAYEKYTPVIYNTPVELLNAFKDGEISVAVLPPDKAALCYANTNCYVTAITNGCNYYIAENGNTIHDITDLNGKTITVSAEDSMADTILNIILNANNISVSYNFVDTNEQLINGLKDGSISLALTQEPHLSKATSDTVRSAIDLYDFWNDAVNTELVTSCLIVNKNFISENPVPFQFFMKDYSAAAAIAKRNTENTAQDANKFALTDNINASKAAIPGCGFIFKTNDDMKTMLKNFYASIAESNADILGGQVPDDNFYYVQQ